LTLVFEYLDKDLKQYMEDVGQIPPYNVKLLLFQLLRGLDYCHSQRVLHRDLKPQNLLINEKGELKLGDFGLARAKSVPMKTYSHEVVTLWYRPPDVLLGNTQYSTQIDLWGVGCILYEMAAGKTLFPGVDVMDELMIIFKTLGIPEPNFSPKLDVTKFSCIKKSPFGPRVPSLDSNGVDLLEKFLVYEAKDRISSAEALKHPYFKELGPEVYKLSNTQSIYSIPTIRFIGKSNKH